MTDTDIRKVIAAERRDLAAALAGLPPQKWDEPTLCGGWRVRELVVHMTMAFRYSTTRFLGEMLASGGNFHRMADRTARRDAARLSTADLTASLGDNSDHPWKPPGGGFQGALSHDVIHGLDFTVALGIDRRVPPERLLMVLRGMAIPGRINYFKVDVRDIRLCADDLDWTYGSGDELRAPAQDLLLVLCGRKLPVGRLSGELGGRFSAA